MAVWLLSPSRVRKARKAHICYFCDNTIKTGETYIEYLGETPGYQSGYRYHVVCADETLVRVTADEKPATYYHPESEGYLR